MIDELPEDLQLLSRFDKIEILWVKKNYKAFKKYLFTMLKYPDVPVISADDDCIYKNNYAEELYQLYKSTHKDIIRYTVRNELIPQGPCTLYAPNNKSHYIDSLLPYINDAIIAESQDDTIASKVIAKSKLTFGCGNKKTPPFIFHDVKCPLNAGQSKQKFYKTLF
ncbi:MAG: hypothetical protein MJZ25_08835 [Fibrobacter sp.]|nr:hypothetical protein [Fibrobacter sp.]